MMIINAKSFAGYMNSDRWSRRAKLCVYVCVQIILWTIAHVALAVYAYAAFRFVLRASHALFVVRFWHVMSYSIFLSVCHGLVIGFVSYYIDKLLSVATSVWKVIVLHFLISITIFILTFFCIRHFTGSQQFPEKYFTVDNWADLFWVLLIQYTIASLSVIVLNQVIRKYGPDIFVPLLLGRYRTPKEERRIFLFIDIKSSTTLAEKLGHLKYSGLVHDFMLDINRCLFKHRASIYQYAGDEVVVTWFHARQNVERCMAFFFSCRQRLQQRSDWYQAKYGVVPTFKAGADCGVVTAVEIGDLKRDIAYHGDTVNTAARIQGLCNDWQRELLFSEAVFKSLPRPMKEQVEFVGEVVLKGKAGGTRIYGVAAKRPGA